ncbi:MAG: DEAD/DEAH box helicase [Saprospiraceae bacterium]|nr:DEAD/DEAH box helicase [Saprospiraceae bacterium]
MIRKLTVDIQSILKTYFGYDSFRPMQEEVIQWLLDGNDSLVIMPTGGGKSVCFQVPALYLPNMSIVVSPPLH